MSEPGETPPQLTDAVDLHVVRDGDDFVLALRGEIPLTTGEGISIRHSGSPLLVQIVSERRGDSWISPLDQLIPSHE